MICTYNSKMIYFIHHLPITLLAAVSWTPRSTAWFPTPAAVIFPQKNLYPRSRQEELRTSNSLWRCRLLPNGYAGSVVFLSKRRAGGFRHRALALSRDSPRAHRTLCSQEASSTGCWSRSRAVDPTIASLHACSIRPTPHRKVFALF